MVTLKRFFEYKHRSGGKEATLQDVCLFSENLRMKIDATRHWDSV
jgi:hypothetical protein